MTGELRWFWGVVLILANLLNAYVAYGAVVIQPQGVWDEHTLTGIEVASALAIALGVVTTLLALVPVRQKVLSRWWPAPSLVFLAVGAARWAYIVHTYPPVPGR
ncbi:hypothetical protein B046DRAFT_01547 [Streptomyces sp. LamerLS-316]|uniref:hypothetical protein n=1 Tax=unclassified Streptomyces TaxID=2593676 RepID=UPI000823F191|nr:MULTISPECIES: hypothetical protein [unclassified Streptomyces]MYQ40508.1 hypothetical protein [Streptomyces sp. SID4921]SCK15951.1 hypothetical protein B046DRAFT_01547 [Streptomyces sp. LamerLS-316]